MIGQGNTGSAAPVLIVRSVVLLLLTFVVAAGCGGSGDSTTDGPAEPGAGTVVSDAELPGLDPMVRDAASWARGMTYRSRSGIDDDNTHVTGSVFVTKDDPPATGYFPTVSALWRHASGRAPARG